MKSVDNIWIEIEKIYKMEYRIMYIKSKVWSNAFFVIPLSIALWYQLFFHSILILLVMVFSIMYHYSNEKKFGIMDKVFAYSIIAYNLYLCYISNLSLPCFLSILLFVLIGLYFFFIKKKDDYEWHISCVIITTFCLLAYVT